MSKIRTNRFAADAKILAISAELFHAQTGVVHRRVRAVLVTSRGAHEQHFTLAGKALADPATRTALSVGQQIRLAFQRGSSGVLHVLGIARTKQPITAVQGDLFTTTES